MTQPTSAEPSMEEILASIRRIISEDPASASADHEDVLDDEEDVLILRERAPAETPAPNGAPEAKPVEAAAGAAEDHVAEPALPQEAAVEKPEPAATAEAAPDPAPTEPPETTEPLAGVAEPAAEAPPISTARTLPAVAVRTDVLVAPRVAQSAAASFERLYFVVDTPPPPTPSPAISASGPTLEDLTREMLRPLVKAWLDENLDAIVRARVDEEVDRIARGRVR